MRTLILALAFDCLLSLAFSPASIAKVALPPVFSDGAILQRDCIIPIWGRAAPGEKISVQFANQNKSTVAKPNGSWTLSLDPLKVDAKNASNGNLTITGSDNKFVLKNIKIGDVFICSGQSNMNLSIIDSDTPEEDLEEPEKSGVRIFRVPDSSLKAKISYANHWLTPNSAIIKSLPAIPFLMAKKVSEKEKVPVGIICAALSGAGIESFLPPETASKAACPANNVLNHFPVSSAFKNFLEPYLKFAKRGVVWYQGESNIFQPAAYKAMFVNFINDLRKRMNSADTPFYFVQLPGFGHYLSTPQDSYWAELRQAQTAALNLANVFMVVSVDTADDAPLHPREKLLIANRLAEQVGKRWQAPSKILTSINGNEVSLRFADESTLLSTTNDEDPRGFQIAGANKVFHRAVAELQDNSILLRSKAVAAPVAVRYGWADSPDCNILKDSQPLSPFRTDNFPTHPKLNPAPML